MSQTELPDKTFSPDEDRRSLDTTSDALSLLCRFINVEMPGPDKSKHVTATDDLLASGIVDSLGVMRLVAFIESAFLIAVPPEDVTIENFVCVQAIADYLTLRMKSVRPGDVASTSQEP